MNIYKNPRTRQYAFLRDQRYRWLKDPNNRGNEYYNQTRQEFEYYNDKINEQVNAHNDRMLKVGLGLGSIVGGLLGIGVSARISNSVYGPKFDANQKGLAGKITSMFFK
jgi:hypothetical protein